MDEPVLEWLNQLFVHHKLLREALVVLEDSAVAVVLASWALMLMGSPRRTPRAAVVVGAAAVGLALLVTALIGELVARPRPFEPHEAHVVQLRDHESGSGFPSQHAGAAFAFAVPLAMSAPAPGAIALCWAVLLSVGRVGLGVHYPTDVIAGAAIGAAISYGLVRLSARRRTGR